MMKGKNMRRPLFLLGVFMVSLAMVMSVFMVKDAHALRVTMKRIIFEGATRTETLMIINNNAKEQTFRLGWRSMRMTENVTLKNIEEGEDVSDLKSADDLIRFAPRRITLPPGGSQQIRFLLRRPKDLEDGEYRSHFWISPEAEVEAFSTSGDLDDEKSAVKLEMLAGIVIPVFVRHGKVEVSSEMKDLKASHNASGGIDVSFTVTRKGNRSLYGDFEFICASSGNSVMRQILGLSLYTEVNKRHFKYDIPKDFHEDVAGCKQLTVRYVADAKDALYKGEAMAEATAAIN